MKIKSAQKVLDKYPKKIQTGDLQQSFKQFEKDIKTKNNKKNREKNEIKKFLLKELNQNETDFLMKMFQFQKIKHNVYQNPDSHAVITAKKGQALKEYIRLILRAANIQGYMIL